MFQKGFQLKPDESLKCKVDLLYETPEGELVIVDYKTTSKGSLKEIESQYHGTRLQISVFILFNVNRDDHR